MGRADVEQEVTDYAMINYTHVSALPETSG